VKLIKNNQRHPGISCLGIDTLLSKTDFTIEPSALVKATERSAEDAENKFFNNPAKPEPNRPVRRTSPTEGLSLMILHGSIAERNGKNLGLGIYLWKQSPVEIFER